MMGIESPIWLLEGKEKGILMKDYQVNRRSFLKGGLLAAGVASMGALAGCAAGQEGSAMAQTGSGASREWDATADVVVVGLSGGMGAVLSAIESGASVIGVEKGSNLGGNWAINTGVVFAPATDAMKQAGDVDERTGKEDTIEAALADWIRCTKGNCDEVLAEAILREEQAFINGLVAEGQPVKTELCGMADAPVARGHYLVDAQGNRQGGGAFTSILVDRVNQTDAVIMTDTMAKDLIFDENYNVIGVEVSEDGKQKFLGCKAVVLAMGGYTANQELRARWNKESSGWGVIGNNLAQGDGYYILLNHGAALEDFKTISPSVTLEVNSCDTYETNNYQIFWDRGPASLVMLDSAGKRNRAETQPYTQMDGSLLTVPAYQVFDQAQYDDPTFMLCNGWSKDSLAKAVEDGFVVKADTLEELAELLYLDPEVVKAEIEEYNAGVAAGQDKFGRAVDTMRALEAPYYASTGTNGISGTDCNGIKVDSDGRVLDRDGNPIKGVYGGGNDMYASNWAGTSYIASGTGAGGTYAFSVITGRNAAAYALSQA